VLVNPRRLVISGTRSADSAFYAWQIMRVNIIMLGFLAAVSDLVPHDALREAVRASVPEGAEDLNLSAFDKGYAYGREHSSHKGR
jgi:Pyruvate/2-oxoacid:ferredoxin oxidoreductase gamma subunit